MYTYIIIFNQYIFIMNVRFAPSPSGKMQLGNLFTLFVNVWFSLKYNVKLFLRIDDTDRKRIYSCFIDNLLDISKKLNINFHAIDESKIIGVENNILYAFKRESRYLFFLRKLLKEKKVFVCKCKEKEYSFEKCFCKEKKYDFFFRQSCVRVNSEYLKKNFSLKYFIFHDLIRGYNKFTIDDVKDFVLLRTNGEFVYYLPSVVDDYDLNITTIIRSSEWILSTPRQVSLYLLLNLQVPFFLHLPIIKTVDGRKLSKRDKNGCCNELIYKMGILPSSLQNYILYLIFSYQKYNLKEIFSMSYAVKKFQKDDIKKSSPKIDIKKIIWFNRKYLQKTEGGEIIKYLYKTNSLPCEKKIVLNLVNELKMSFDNVFDIKKRIEEILNEDKYEKKQKQLSFAEQQQKTIVAQIVKDFLFQNNNIENLSNIIRYKQFKDFLLKKKINNITLSAFLHMFRFLIIGEKKGESIGLLLLLAKKVFFHRIEKNL